MLGAAWSPNGGTLAFVPGTTAGCCPLHRRLETVSADRTQLRMVTREHAGTQIQDDPVWTRDGKRILITVASP